MIIIPIWACILASVAGFALVAFERYGEETDRPWRVQSWIVFIALFGAVTNLFTHFSWYWAAAIAVLCYAVGNWVKLFLDEKVKPLSWLAPIAVIAGLVPQYANLGSQ